MQEPINVTDAAFERAVLQAELPVTALFWSRDDPKADQLRETSDAAAQRYAGEVRVVRIEAQDAPQTHLRYETSRLPQFLFFRAGKLVARAHGYPTQNGLGPWIDFLLGRGPAPSTRAQRPGGPSHPIEVTDTNFDQLVLGSNLPVMVDFWAAWCGPCRMVAPVVEMLATEFSGRALVAKLDVEANPRTAQRYSAMSIPTLIFFRDGKEVNRLVGAQPEEVLRYHLDAFL